MTRQQESQSREARLDHGPESQLVGPREQVANGNLEVGERKRQGLSVTSTSGRLGTPLSRRLNLALHDALLS